MFTPGSIRRSLFGVLAGAVALTTVGATAAAASPEPPVASHTALQGPAKRLVVLTLDRIWVHDDGDQGFGLGEFSSQKNATSYSGVRFDHQ